MSKFDLFKDLESASSNKKTYQIYEIQSGIELIKAKVPLDKTTEFETMFEQLTEIDSYSVKKILDKVGGQLQD